MVALVRTLAPCGRPDRAAVVKCRDGPSVVLLATVAQEWPGFGQATAVHGPAQGQAGNPEGCYDVAARNGHNIEGRQP